MKKCHKFLLYLIIIYSFLVPLVPENNGTFNIVTWAIFLVILMVYISNIILQKNKLLDLRCNIINFFSDYLNIFTIAIFFIMLISVTYAWDKKIAIKEAIRFLSYIIIYFIIKYSINSNGKKIIINSILISSVIVSIYGIVQYFTGIGLNKVFIENYKFGASARVTSTLANPNALGAFLVLIISPMITIGIYEKSIWRKVMYLLGSIVNCVCLILTFSRNAYIGLGIGIFILIFLISYKFIVLIIIALGSAMFVPTIKSRIMDISDKTQNIARINLWKLAGKMIKEHPIRGIGNGNFYSQYDKYATKYPSLRYQNVKNYTVHNSYLKIQTEIGVFGSIGFVGMLICSAMKVFRNMKNNENLFLKVFCIGFFASMISFYAMNFIDNLFFVPKIVIIYWIFMSVLE